MTPNPTGLAAIQRAAKANGIAWQPLAAIDYHESGLNPGAVGDNGTSFGLAQLHRGGALPANVTSAQALNPDWNANFQARAVKALNIQGLPVNQQIAQISRRFERPADPSSEIADAQRYYQANYAGQGAATTPAATPAMTPGAPTLAPASLAPLQSGFDLAQQSNQRALSALGKISGTSVQAPQAPNLSALTTSSQTQLQPTAQPVHVPLKGPTPHGLDAQGQKAVALAKTYLGTPYVFGGAKPGGFDCSGLLQFTWGKLGVKIPRTSEQQWKAGTPVPKNQIQPGDAVFFVHPGGDVGHVGMAIGNGQYIEAPHTGDVVKIASLAGASNFIGARRFA